MCYGVSKTVKDFLPFKTQMGASGESITMFNRIRNGIAALLLLSAAPLQAQEWIYCPAAPQELERQCRQTNDVIQRDETLSATVGEQMHDPDIILVRVDRRPDESVPHYLARVKQQQGVATSASNHWLPVRGRYYDPDHQIMYVALDRNDYWQYVWEALEPDEDLARRTFAARERSSQQFKQARFTGPGGKLAQWQQEIETARRFRETCCDRGPGTPPTPGAVTPPPGPLP